MDAPRGGIVHVIDRLTLGGAGRSLIALAAHSARRHGTPHRLVSLRPPHPAAAAQAETAGIRLVAMEGYDAALADADIVHVHFWNTPDLHALLRRALPACRLALTCHVIGSTAPHMLTAETITRADLVLVTSPDTLVDVDASLSERAVVAPSTADFGRIAGVTPQPHAGFNIGYVGSVDFAKMHPRFAAIHASLALPGLRVIVCGDGGARQALAKQAVALGFAERLDLRGYVEDLAETLSILDVFGYPLRDDSYATSELVLQEAMMAGVPVVALAPPGATRAVVHGVAGFIAADEADYLRRIRQLHADPPLRARMAAAAAAHARAEFGPERLGPIVDAAYDRLMAHPKRPRPALARAWGIDAFLASLDTAVAPFAASLAGDPLADAAIMDCPPALASADAGGVLHYRRYYPGDPALHYWAGLVLLGQGRPALAAAEFAAAGKSGFDGARAAAGLARARQAASSDG